MPLPLLIPVLVAGAGVFGIGKTVKAGVDNYSAKEINSDARRNICQADRSLSEKRGALNSALQDYGRQKLNALDRPLSMFIDLFGLLKNVELSDSPDLETLKIAEFSTKTIKELSTSCQLAAQTLSGLASGAGGGALAAFGAYNGAMLFASAGTGTAISSLSGVAATNATLAWLGGGTLASGGLGVAGGALVLGTLVAGPALLIFGSVLGAKASANLSDARSNYAESEKYTQELGLVTDRLDQILRVVLLAQTVFSRFAGHLRRSNKKLKLLIDEAGSDYSSYDEKQKHLVFQSVKFAQLLKALVDMPLLDKDGVLIEGSPLLLAQYQKQLTA